jgi:hypothetical protein
MSDSEIDSLPRTRGVEQEAKTTQFNHYCYDLQGCGNGLACLKETGAPPPTAEELGDWALRTTLHLHPIGITDLILMSGAVVAFQLEYGTPEDQRVALEHLRMESLHGLFTGALHYAFGLVADAPSSASSSRALGRPKRRQC